MDYVLRRACDDPLRKLLRRIVGPAFWLTYRAPWMPRVVVTHPTAEMYPEQSPTLQHELFHVKQFATWWGPWLLPLFAALLPLPVFFSGRWFIERHAYAEDIRNGRCTVDEAVNALWSGYLMPWPKKLMSRWFARATTSPESRSR